jgi:hypothetical protein
VNEDEISAELGFDVRTMPKLVRALQKNPHVQYEDQLYQWRGSLDSVIKDRNQLEDVFKQMRFLTTTDFKGSYKGVEKDIKQLEEEGIIGVFPASTPREKLYFYYDPELSARKAPEEFRQLWETIAIPPSEKSREEALRRFGVEPLAVVPQFEPIDDEPDTAMKRRRGMRRKFLNPSLMPQPE